MVWMWFDYSWNCDNCIFCRQVEISITVGDMVDNTISVVKEINGKYNEWVCYICERKFDTATPLLITDDRINNDNDDTKHLCARCISRSLEVMTQIVDMLGKNMMEEYLSHFELV